MKPFRHILDPLRHLMPESRRDGSQ